MAVLAWTILIVTVLHFLCSLVSSVAKERFKARGIDIELLRQHHEQCMMLGLIALAILYK